MYFHSEIILNRGDAYIYRSLQDFIKTLLKSEYGNTLSAPVQWYDRLVSFLYLQTRNVLFSCREDGSNSGTLSYNIRRTFYTYYNY